MKYITFITSLLLTYLIVGQTNVVSLNYGSKLVASPASYVELSERNLWATYSSGALLDETSNPWCSKNISFPFIFVIELTEEFEINSL